MPQILFDAESRQPARAETIQVAAHVTEADLVQDGGTPRRDVLHRHALVVEHARRRKRRVDWDGGIVSSLIEVVTKDLLLLADDMVDPCDELVLRVFRAGQAPEVVRAGLVGQRLVSLIIEIARGSRRFCGMMLFGNG